MFRASPPQPSPAPPPPWHHPAATSPSSSSSTSRLADALASPDLALPLLLVPLLAWLAIAYLPSFLASTAALVSHVLRDEDDRDPAHPSTATNPPGAYILPGSTSHARFLPASAKHAFSYPTLYLGVELGALEARALDRDGVFAWRGGDRAGGSHAAADATAARRTISTLHPDSYLRNAFAGVAPKSQLHARLRASILEKLGWELRHRGYIDRGPQDEVAGAVDPAATTSSSSSPSPSQDWKSTCGLGQVWMVTMPSFLGITGINPLTVYYLHRRRNDARGGDAGAQRFWLVVLEVHNTFSERHVYFLEAGRGEDDGEAAGDQGGDGAGTWTGAESGSATGATAATSTKGTTRLAPTSGHTDLQRHPVHRWTFPRSFHVSPFNDRGGWYQLTLRELLPCGKSADTDNDTVGRAEARASSDLPMLSVHLKLLVPPGDEGADEAAQDDDDDDDDDRPAERARTKLVATLTSHRSKVAPFSSRRYVASLLRQPLDLVLPMFRILRQAASLHFRKGLRVWPKPELRELGAPKPRAEGQVSGQGQGQARKAQASSTSSRMRNEVEALRHGVAKAHDEARRAGPVLYQAESWAERTARLAIERGAAHRLASVAPSSSSSAAKPSVRRGGLDAVCVTSLDEAAPKLDVRRKDDEDLDGCEGGGTSSGISLSDGGRGDEVSLRIVSRSQQVYTDLLLWPTLRVSHAVASAAGRRWELDAGGVDLGEAERALGSAASSRRGVPLATRLLAYLCGRVREAHVRWALSVSPPGYASAYASVFGAAAATPACANDGPTSATPVEEMAGGGAAGKALPVSTKQPQRQQEHALDALPTLASTLTLVWLHVLARLERAASLRLGVRYVRGEEPWEELRRALDALAPTTTAAAAATRVAAAAAGEEGCAAAPHGVRAEAGTTSEPQRRGEEERGPGRRAESPPRRAADGALEPGWDLRLGSSSWLDDGGGGVVQ